MFTWRALAVIWLCGATSLSCKTVFVTATPRVVGTATDAKPNTGYLKVEITSNLEAFSTQEYSKVAQGFKYLSVGVTISNTGSLTPGTTPPEYPLLLIDLKTRAMVTVINASPARGEYVNFESSQKPVLTFSIRAIPKTIATTYADAFQTLQQLSSGLPLSQISGSNPYLALAGRMLGSIAQEANKSNTQTSTTAILGLTNSAANTSPFPLDGTPVVLFIRRSDTPPPLPEPSALKLCANNPGAVCITTKSGEATYNALPYLIVRASTTDYRPTLDWAETHWTCDVPKRADQIDHIERALRATRFTEQQERVELMMLGRVKALSRAYAMPDNFDLKQSANVAAFASILNSWRFTGSDDGSFWNKNYKSTASALEACFQNEMKRRSLQHETAFTVLERAFAAIRSYRAIASFPTPLTDDQLKQLETWLTQTTEPIRFLGLKDGETYGSLRAEQDSMERLLIERDKEFAGRLTDATKFMGADSDKIKADIRSIVNARLLSPCDSCRAVLTDAIAQANLLEANAAKQAQIIALQEAEKARGELISTRQRAEQLARLAEGLKLKNEYEVTQLRASVEATRSQMISAKADKQQLLDAIKQLDRAADAVQTKVLAK